MAESRLDVIVRTRGQDQLEKLHRTTRDTEKQLDKLGGRLRNSQGKFVATGKAAESAASGIRGAGEAARKSTADVNKLDRALDGLRQGATALKAGLAGLAIGGFFKTIIGSAAEIERVQKRLETLTGSAQTAQKVYEDLQRVNKQSPFELGDLAGAAAKLSAYGVETEKLVTTTERLGKISAATQSDIEGIALAYGQVRVKGRLQGEELLQFAERGIPLQAELARMLGKSGEEVSDLVSKGRIGFPLVEKAIENLTGETGQFGKAFENTADSIDAKLSNLQDAFKLAAGALGKAFEPVFKWMVEQLTGILNLVERAISQWQSASTLTPERISALREQARKETDSKFGFFDFGGKSQFYNQRLDQLVRAATQPRPGSGGQAAPRVTAAPSPGEIARNNSMLSGGTRPGGSGGSRSTGSTGSTGGRAAGPTLPSSIHKEELRKWLYSQGMGRTSGDFTNAGHRTPNHMLNAMDMGFTHPRYDRNYVQKTIEMERKLRATGAFGNQLFGPERDPRGHATHLHIPTPGGRVKMTPGLAALMGMQGASPEGNMALQEGIADQALEAEIKAQEARERSLQQGQEMLTNEQRRLETLRANGDYEKDLLQIKFELEDKLKEIGELQDATQKEKLTTLVNQSAELERQAALSEEIERAVSKPTAFQMPETQQSPIQQKMDQLKAGFADVQGQIVQISESFTGTLASSFSSAITGLIQGTETVKSAFSKMFASIGQSFMQMAVQMLSQRLLFGILGMFGGGGVGGFTPFSMPGGGLLGGGSLGLSSGFSFAGGGYTGDGARAGGIDGQGGFPAILHPQETVIDHSSLRGGMGGKSGGGGASPINLNVTATKIGGEEFVKVQDLQVALRNSEKRAAAQGEQRAMAKFQNSPRTRKRLGIA